MVSSLVGLEYLYGTPLVTCWKCFSCTKPVVCARTIECVGDLTNREYSSAQYELTESIAEVFLLHTSSLTFLLL